MKNNMIECFEKYVVEVFENKTYIFIPIRKDYIIAFKWSLKFYIAEMKSYLIENKYIMNQDNQSNYLIIDQNFINI